MCPERHETLLLGTSQKPLFGLYHAPNGGSPRLGGIVLCYPLGLEYLRVHRSFRELANRLAGLGFHALRFDYYGSGDSGGESEDGDVSQWVEDIAMALEEIRETSGSPRVSLVGVGWGPPSARWRERSGSTSSGWSSGIRS
jgi:alpha-beta hydrolase superfamily lysophospholipase